MKQKLFIFLVVLTVSSGCFNIKLNWSDKRLNELWVVLPNDLNECLVRLDTLLSENSKTHFKKCDESLAVIEISHELGRSFIAGWHLIPKALAYDRPRKKIDTWSEIHLTSPYSNLSNSFNKIGVDDPMEMIRIIFTCYHRKLNNSTIDLNSILDYFSSFWVNSRQISMPADANVKYLVLDESVEIIEDSISNKFYFDKLQINDTLCVSLYYENHRFTSKPKTYKIDAVIRKKDDSKQTLLAELLNISSEKNTSVWIENNTQRNVGDTIELRANSWSKKGEKMFYYR